MTTPLETVKWIHGAPDCALSADPLIQVHVFEPDTYIFRLSKCFSYEGNFIYLLFGSERAIVFDTGGPPGQQAHDDVMPIRETIEKVIAERLGARGQNIIHLVVAHTHGHGDHVFWDRQFADRPNTTIVRPALVTVKSFFNLPQWPHGMSEVDLGQRKLTVFPIPGHEASHLAVYDQQTKILLTGDTLYPGLLTVQDWPEYRQSAARLASFAANHEISYVLGNHIEMMNAPRQLYPIGTTYQPHEHPLPLSSAHIAELHTACEALANAPHRDVHDDFIIEPLN